MGLTLEGGLDRRRAGDQKHIAKEVNHVATHLVVRVSKQASKQLNCTDTHTRRQNMFVAVITVNVSSLPFFSEEWH